MDPPLRRPVFSPRCRVGQRQSHEPPGSSGSRQPRYAGGFHRTYRVTENLEPTIPGYYLENLARKAPPLPVGTFTRAKPTCLEPPAPARIEHSQAQPDPPDHTGAYPVSYTNLTLPQ